MTKKQYLPAIDGMRTIAVSLVLLFHVDLAFVSGGYIGVDVFFVISGFLITGIIVRQGDGFSFGEFYTRRLRRLIPALLATIAVSMLAALFILNPAQLEQSAEQAIFAAVSASNILLWLQSGYFDTASHDKLFLHTWSLSVEEQFYLFWPAFILVLLKLRGSALLIGLVLASLLSFGGALYFHQDYPSSVFYLTPFRVFQFALGALVYVLSLKIRGNLGLISSILAALGLVGLSYVLEGATAGIWEGMLLPAVLTAILLMTVESERVANWLGSAPMVWVGQRSYSIYLTHWPIVVLWKMATDVELTGIEAIGLLLAAVASGTLLHWTVEARFRAPKGEDAQRRVVYATLISISAILFASTLISLRAGDEIDRLRAEQFEANANAVVWSERSLTNGRRRAVRIGTCHLVNADQLASFDRDVCLATNPETENWLVVGDSYAADTWFVMNSSNRRRTFLQLTFRGCLPLMRADQPANKSSACLDYSDLWPQLMAQNPDITGVILAGRWDQGLTEEISNTVQAVEASGRKVVIMGTRARFALDLPADLMLDPSLASISPSAGLRPEIAPMNNEISSAFGSKVLDVLSIQCGTTCPLRDSVQRPLYTDDGHLSVFGVEFFGRNVARAFDTAANQP